MEAPRPCYFYRETRLNLDSGTSTATVSIRLPTSVSSTGLSVTKVQNSTCTNNPGTDDEISFRQKYLTTASSIYQCRHFNSSKRYLWRVLENGKVLSIRAVDVSTQADAKDSCLDLNFIFPHSILPACVALSNSQECDVLSVFLLTESKQVWTLDLRPEFFRKVSSMDENMKDWWNIYSPKSLGIKVPHRLVALSANELLISFHDGALVRLERTNLSDGKIWNEQQYNEGGWSHSFRSIVPFHNSNGILYEGHFVQPSAATSIASPVTNINGTPFAFTVTIDHRLRIWDLTSGRIAYSGDILTQEPENQGESRKIIDPSLTHLVQVLTDDSKETTCITYSPLYSGEFKLWNIIADENRTLELVDLLPDNSLVPQSPSSDIWTLADFVFVPDKLCKDNLSLWVLWKNNVTYQLSKLYFSTGSTDHVRKSWSHAWEAVVLDNLGDIPIPQILPCDSSDVTEKWLDFILFPGRFSITTLETGLAIYDQGLSLEKDNSQKSKSLADRMCTSIGSTAVLTRISDGSLGYDQFRSATHIQWLRFYRLLIELHEQRGEAMSLVIDAEGNMPWVVLADGVSAIRECSHLEKMWYNNTSRVQKYKREQTLLYAATNFRNSLPENFVYECTSLLREEVLQEPSLTIKERIQEFYKKCDFANQIGDDEYDELLRNLGDNFKDLSPQVYANIIKSLSPSEVPKKVLSVLPMTKFGINLLVKGVQQIVQLHRSICLDQLILLVLIENEIDFEEGTNLDNIPVYDLLISILARLELIHWLTSTQISLPVQNFEPSSLSLEYTNLAKKTALGTEIVTIFEGVFRHLFSLDMSDDQNMSSAITKILVKICDANSGYEVSPAVVQCFLLKHERPDLALEFSQFTSNDAFSIYVQGRAHLAVNETCTAARLLKKAAVGLALPNKKQRIDFRSAGYLDEAEKCLLNAGLSKYYSHIVNLFHKANCHSYVAEFAQLSLQFIGAHDYEENIPTQMHTRLFNAALHTARYELAHSVLALFTDSSLQYSSLRILVTKMCETSNSSKLIGLPFIGLIDKVDEILYRKCQCIKNVLVDVPYHKILYAWRIKHNDFRGAALILLERLLILQHSGDSDVVAEGHQFETPVTQQYVSLINTLSCVDSKNAWVLLERKTSLSLTSNHKEQPKRQVITLSDIRSGYQMELDRLAAIENNQFTYEETDAMDIL